MAHAFHSPQKLRKLNPDNDVPELDQVHPLLRPASRDTQ